jgi:hypothetical protein
MAHSTTITRAIERLDYRVTIGDVAAEAGLPLAEAQQGVLALATDVQAHLQVSEAGEIAYLFPKNLQAILLSKSWRLRLQSAWQRIWRVLFYLIRISFGIMLILSLVLIVVAISILVIAASSARQGDDRDGGFGGGGGMIFLPRMGFGPNIFWFFDYDYGRRRRQQPRGRDADMNFLEAVFSFLFGDGDPNTDLEERRWQSIASLIRANQGVITAEQAAPFLATLGQGWAKDFEDYMIPVLSRFNGLPQVSPTGGIVYQFPELQVMAKARQTQAAPGFLQELPRRFSRASSGQILGAIGLGGANLIGALALGSLLTDQGLVAQIGGLVAFVDSIYWLLLGYGVAFLTVPLVRYFWVQRQNSKIANRNQQRQERATVMDSPDSDLQEKLTFARTLASQTVLNPGDVAYTTETDLVEQEYENKDQIDAEWQRRLRESNSP